VCAGCELCSGGWPQDAFEYVVKHGGAFRLHRISLTNFQISPSLLLSTLGLPLESVMPYSADYLLLISEQVAGNSDELEYVDLSIYGFVAMRNLTCGFPLFDWFCIAVLILWNRTNKLLAPAMVTVVTAAILVTRPLYRGPTLILDMGKSKGTATLQPSAYATPTEVDATVTSRTKGTRCEM
jgi:hypothetical protein